jgi:hypothetical protein
MVALVVLGCVAGIVISAGAQHNARTVSKGASPAARGPRFTDRERETISKYFHNPYSNLPSSLKNGGTDVPPNVRKQVVRSAVLPPELQPRVVPLPPPLEARLPRLAKPYQRAVVGPDVIILNRKTQWISDVIRSVLIPAHTMYN